MGESRPTSRQSGRPFFWALIAAMDAAISAYFSHPDIGLGMDPKIGYAYPRLGPRKRAPLIPNDWSAISGRRMGTRDQSTTNPADFFLDPNRG